MTREFARMAALLFSTCAGLVAPSPVAAQEDACAPVRAMIAKFNVVPKVRATGWGTSNGWSGVVDEIAIGPKRYSREDDGSWTTGSRKVVPPDIVTNCVFLRDEDVSGVATVVHGYERDFEKLNYRIEIWISKETGLPVKSHFKLLPLDGISEKRLTYSYGDDVKAPI